MEQASSWVYTFLWQKPLDERRHQYEWGGHPACDGILITGKMPVPPRYLTKMPPSCLRWNIDNRQDAGSTKIFDQDAHASHRVKE
ncbi:hypothetical protein [Moorena sp. SIO3E8]|uniref:hypothetical protein n=1 Tax=unclassified Moorena TaxID=2683338 RepID=UPI0025F35F35|nr:hypothetical protein [Moorena sp. SIO3E8]